MSFDGYVLTWSNAYEAAQHLLHLMTVRATTDDRVDGDEFAAARKAVLDDPRAAKLAPVCVVRCRTPTQLWSYIKSDPEGQTLRSYHSRRVFLAEKFEPLLSALERFDSSPLDDLVSDSTAKLDAVSITAAWQKALERRTTDPEGAITAARTLLEGVCKTILDDRGIERQEKDDLPKLYSRLAGELNLAPSDHTEQGFKSILGSCANVVKELGSLRNRISDSHAGGRVTYQPAERHAVLAVNLAGSMALFLQETHENYKLK